MFTNTNMNAYNNMPLKNGELNNAVLDKNANMYVGDNILEDPIIQDFINQIPGWFSEGLYAVKMITLTLVLYFTYGLALCLFGLTVTTFWPLIQEWIEVICAVTSIATTATFLKWIYDDTEMADQYIVKLKAELAARDDIIAELKLALIEAESKLDTDSDSDYDPDLDEY
jgi:hypothetical protein